MSASRYRILAYFYGLIGVVAMPLLCSAAAHAADRPRPAWHETVLYRFHGPEAAAEGDGAFPQGGVVRDGSGRLYGTTSGGGSNGNGTVFSVAPPAYQLDRWHETILHEFEDAGDDGASPVDRPLLGADGVLYGTTQAGGAFCHGLLCIGGTVFGLVPPPTNLGAWTERVLLSFSDDNSGGDAPRGDLIAVGGVLYGTAALTHFGDAGTVFRVDGGPAAADETILHAFNVKQAAEGVFPEGGVVADASGNLYGTTLEGGNAGGPCGSTGCGVVFELLPPAEHRRQWSERVLHAFDGADGSSPFASLTFGGNGALYGTTYSGGLAACQNGCGVVFKLTPPASGRDGWSESVLHYFGATRRDGYWAGLRRRWVADERGALYGTTLDGGDRACGSGAGCGIVFQLIPHRGGRFWEERVLHRFSGMKSGDGEGPAAGLLRADHTLYGTTEIGGGGRCYNGCGTVFSLQEF